MTRNMSIRALAIAVVVLSTAGLLAFFPSRGDVASNPDGVDTVFSHGHPIVSFSARTPGPDGSYTPPATSDFWSANVVVDEHGVPYFEGEGGQRFYNVSTVAFAAIQSQTSYPELDLSKLLSNRSSLTPKQISAFNWLEDNIVTLDGNAITWHYDFDLNYNNMLVKAGWPSAFAQAAVIQAYILAFDLTNESRYLDRAHEAARAYLVSVDRGGLTSDIDGSPFFEEVPLPNGYSPHVLNGHLYSLVVLEDLIRRRPDDELRALIDRAHAGTKTLLPIFDQGYWTRYDLKPRFVDVPLMFRPVAPATILRALSMAGPDGSSKRIEVSASGRSGARDVFYGTGWSWEGDGSRMGARDTLGQFMLPLPDDAPAPLGNYRLSLELGPDDAPPTVAIFGSRQRVREYYPLRFEGLDTEGGRTVANYSLDLKDLQWSDLQRYYVEWHQRLVAALNERHPDPIYAVTAYRWQGYLDNHADMLVDRLRSLGERAMPEREQTIGDEVKRLLSDTEARLVRRIAVISDEPALDAEIVRRVGNEPLGLLSRKDVVERLIRNAPTDGATADLVTRIRRLGIETRLFELSGPSLDQPIHLIEVQVDGQPAAYDPIVALAFELRGEPASVGTALASFASDRPPVPQVAGQVPMEPDQLTFRSLRGDDGPYGIVVDDLTVHEVEDPALAGLPLVPVRRVNSIGASVLESTKFHPGHGPEIALGPERPGGYSAAREGLLTNSFTFRTPEPMVAKVLEIRWNATADYPREFRLFSVADSKEELLLHIKDYQPSSPLAQFAIEPASANDTFRFEATDFAGQDRLIIQSFRLRGDGSS